ncbi:MAG: response regulator [Chitinophagaceae bacterium]|nr:response regulator [Chitinophagaceae bacterium]
MSKKKILVVDDDPDMLISMKSWFHKKGFMVAVTTTCNEALSKLINFQPDIICLDVNVGEEDGRETCLHIKSQAAYQHIPVILFSANHDYGDSYKHWKADAFLEKPFSFQQLTALVQSHL